MANERIWQRCLDPCHAEEENKGESVPDRGNQEKDWSCDLTGREFVFLHVDEGSNAREETKKDGAGAEDQDEKSGADEVAGQERKPASEGNEQKCFGEFLGAEIGEKTEDRSEEGYGGATC